MISLQDPAQPDLSLPCGSLFSLSGNQITKIDGKWFFLHILSTRNSRPITGGIQRVHLRQLCGCYQGGAKLPITVPLLCFSSHCRAVWECDSCTPWGQVKCKNAREPWTSYTGPWDLTRAHGKLPHRNRHSVDVQSSAPVASPPCTWHHSARWWRHSQWYNCSKTTTTWESN